MLSGAKTPHNKHSDSDLTHSATNRRKTCPRNSISLQRIIQQSEHPSERNQTSVLTAIVPKEHWVATSKNEQIGTTMEINFL